MHEAAKGHIVHIAMQIDLAMGPPALPRLLARLAMGPEAYARASAGNAGGDSPPPAPELLRFGAHVVLALVALRLLPAQHDTAAPPSVAPLQVRGRAPCVTRLGPPECLPFVHLLQ